MRSASRQRGFTLLEVLISCVLIITLLMLLLPALSAARRTSHRERCAANLTRIGEALHASLEENRDRFPAVAGQPDWRWGGLRFSSADGRPYLDNTRPLNRWVSPASVTGSATGTFCCPADHGISGEVPEAGTGGRSACRAFGTSYRANAALFDARLAGVSQELRGLSRHEIDIAPSRLLVLGDATWYEQYESTGRDADWHGSSPGPGHGNILFLDGSVRFRAARPRGVAGPVVIEPVHRGDGATASGGEG